MSEIHSTDPFCDLETQIQNKVDAAKAGKREVSNAQFVTLFLVLVVIVGCLAAQNAMYGYSQGGTLAAMVLLAVLYAAGDFALATLTSLQTRRATAGFLSFVVKVGLISLSLVSGIAFMLSQQAQTDRADSRIASLESQIAINQEAFAQYHKTVTANRLVALNEQLSAERKRVGADHAATNAIYVHLASLTGRTFEEVSFAVRAAWIAIFILTGMSLSALLGLLWCPWKEGRAHASALREQHRATARQRAQLKILRAQQAVTSELQAMQTAGGTQISRKKQQSQSTRHSGTRAPTQDTATAGPTSTRYEDVKSRIVSGSLKPSVSAVRRAAGCGTVTARDYLKQLARENVVALERNRYVLLAH